MLSRRSQRGVGLVELMVGVAIALVMVAGAITLYARMVQGGSTSTRQVELNQSLRAVMNIINYDLHRAGYSASATAGTAANPFTQRGAGATDLVISTDYRCILYSYDLNQDGLLNAGEVFGFRFNSTAKRVEALNQSLTTTAGITDCSQLAWMPLSQPRSVTISDMSFSTEGSQCLAFAPSTYTPGNSATFQSWALTAPNYAAACDVTTSGGNSTPVGASTLTTPYSSTLLGRTELRQITVSITAAHARDSGLQRTLKEVIRLRNDRVM